MLLLLIGKMSFGAARMINLNQELRQAKWINEIIILSYTVKVDQVPGVEPVQTEKLIEKITYVWADRPDSVLTYYPNNQVMYGETAFYRLISDSSVRISNFSEGYWPAVGDTILAVMNNKNQFSLFGEILTASEKHYKLWSPYRTGGLLTLFFFNNPFSSTYNGERVITNAHLQTMARKRGYQHVSEFHCYVDKKSLDQYLKKLRPVTP